MVDTIIPTKVQALTAALESLKPGEEVRYGSHSDGHAVGLGNEDYRTVLKLVEDLDTKGRIMRFHRHGYYVAQGVTPRAKQIIELWVALKPLPVRSGL